MASYPSGQSAFGTLLKLGNQSSPETYNTVANVGDYNGPQTKLTSVKTTSHSTSIPWDTYIPTIIDPGALAFPIFAKTDSTSWELLVDAFVNRQMRDWQIVLPDSANTTLNFTAFIEQLSLKHPVAGVTTADISLKLSGEINYGF